MGIKTSLSLFVKIFVPVVQCSKIFRIRGCVLFERQTSPFENRVRHLCFLHALNGSINPVSAEHVCVSRVLDSHFVSHLKEHLIDKSIRRSRNVTHDVQDQLLCLLIRLDWQHKLAADDDFQHHHTNAPEIPV